MVFRRVAFLALALTLCVLILPELALAADASRIELKDGEILKDVSFTADRVYQVITIQTEDVKRNFSFGDIAAIYDANGADITSDVLGKYYQPRGRTGRDISQGKPAALMSGERAYPWSVAFHIQPLFSIPLGDFYDGFGGDIGYGGEISFPVSREIAIRGSVSRAGVKPDFAVPPGVDFSVWRYVLSVQYYNWPRWREDGRTMYFLFSGLGAITHKVSEPNHSEDLTKFMTALGGGVLQSLSESVGIEGCIEWDAVYVGTTDDGFSYYGNVQYAFILDFRVGLVVLL
jgi:hypothetical protein